MVYYTKFLNKINHNKLYITYYIIYVYFTQKYTFKTFNKIIIKQLAFVSLLFIQIKMSQFKKCVRIEAITNFKTK